MATLRFHGPSTSGSSDEIVLHAFVMVPASAVKDGMLNGYRIGVYPPPLHGNPIYRPPPGFVPIATVTFPVNPVPIRPDASSAVTCTAGVMVPPAATLPGSTVNTSCVNAVMLNWTLETAVRPVEVARSRYPVPGLLMLRSENVATPATAATIFAPDRVPPPGLEPEGIAIVTLPLKPVTTLFPASSAVTWIGGVITALAGVVVG